MKRFDQFVNELVQPDFFQKNPDFYLNKRDSSPSKYENEMKELKEEIKKINVKDIRVEYDPPEVKFYPFYVNNSNKQVYFKKSNQKDKYNIISISNYSYLWKFILASIWKFNFKTIIFKGYFDYRENINEVFKNISEYFGLYYYSSHGHFVLPTYELFLTKDSKKYSNKIKECKQKNIKIIYYNANVKGGRDFFDIEGIGTIDDVKKFKNINVDDIYFEKVSSHYVLHFKNENLDKIYLNLSSNSRFDFCLAMESQMEENLFGNKIGHRYHVGTGLTGKLQGIGLGYKVYKAFIKEVGYICSNSQTSGSAQKIYLKLLNDPDYYTIVDNIDSRYRSKVIVIDKNYQYIPELLKLVKEREKLEHKTYVYDKNLTSN